jgi:hypothetical protein
MMHREYEVGRHVGLFLESADSCCTASDAGWNRGAHAVYMIPQDFVYGKRDAQN